MKKILFVLAICLFGMSQNAGASVYSTLPVMQNIVMLPCLEGEGLDMLDNISNKCSDESVSCNDFTQAEYAYMIRFCNEMLDAADEYDARGESELFIENSKDQMDLLIGFVTLLTLADNEGVLDVSNKKRLEEMSNRLSE